MMQDDAAIAQQLIIRAQNGDLESFNQLIDCYQGLIYRVCYRILGNAAKAEDATQDTFLKAWTSLEQFHGGSFKSWLTRIATNRCYDILRAERRRPAQSLDAEPFETEPRWSIEPADEEPDHFASRSQLSHVLEQALQHLSEDQRTVIVLYDVHGYSYDEIAEITGATLGTVKSRISRGRLRLRELLQQNEHARELFDAVWRHSSDEETRHTGHDSPASEPRRTRAD